MLTRANPAVRLVLRCLNHLFAVKLPSQAGMVLGQGTCYGYATLLKAKLVFNSDPLENLLENRQKFDSGLLD